MILGNHSPVKKHTTLQDIADYCRLSKSMVAQVIRDPENCKAAPRTKQAITEAARKLNYQPNMTAKALSTNRYHTVGVMFPAVNSFYYELTIHLEDALARRDYYALFSYYHSRDILSSFRESFERLRRHGIDGIITCEYDEALANCGLPVVTYGNERRLMDCVFPDKLNYAAAAVDYLVQCGHRTIGFIGLFIDIRQRKICEELTRRSLPVNPDWMIDCGACSLNGYKAMRQILNGPERPTAVITHSDHMAFGALHAARECGVAVPDDISVLSYDNLHESAYCAPPLTTFDQQYPLGAELLAETILNRINDPGLPQQKRSFSLPLVERGSVKKLTQNGGLK